MRNEDQAPQAPGAHHAQGRGRPGVAARAGEGLPPRLSTLVNQGFACSIGNMEFTLPDDILKGNQVTAEELRFDLALGLYVDEKVTLGQAARIAGMPSPAFLDELGKRKIPVHYSVEDLAADETTVRALVNGSRS